MNGKFRTAWHLLTAISVLSFVLGGSILYAAPVDPALSSRTTISGPLDLTLAVSPAVAQPRDPVTVRVAVTNHEGHVATPEVVLQLPAALSPLNNHLPSGTVFNFQENSLSWLPIVPAGGGSAQLELSFLANVAEISQPAQPVHVALRYDGHEYADDAEFWVGIPPTVSVRTSPAMVAVGAPVQLAALAGGSGPFVQRWDLGDGRHLVANDPQVVYGSPGTYRVSVTVANPLASATATAGITVVASPSAAFTLDDALPVVAQPVQFTNQSGGLPPQTYRWDFGDGVTSPAVNPTHSFQAPGTYTVRLFVESEYGTAETSELVTVGVGPVVDFVLDSNAGTGRAVRGQAYSDDSVTALHWDMGDGAEYEEAAVEHVYSMPGDYLVTVRAENNYGTSEASHWVHVVADHFSTFLPALARQGVPLPSEQAIIDVSEGVMPAAPLTPAAPSPAPMDPSLAQQTSGAAVQPGGAGAPPEPPVTPIAAGAPVDLTVTVSPLEPAAQPIELPPQAPLPASASPAEGLLWYINEARRLHDLAPLSYNYELSIAAQMHSEDMAGNPDIMHDGSDGSTPAERQRRFGYPAYYGGEAVAWGWDSAVPVVEFWVNSPPHRVLILDPNISEVGVGYYADARAPNIWYWTAEFGVLPGSDPDEMVPNSNPN